MMVWHLGNRMQLRGRPLRPEPYNHEAAAILLGREFDQVSTPSQTALTLALREITRTSCLP
jgi:hypothetical protein